MESDPMPGTGGFYSSLNHPEMLALEMSLHRSLPPPAATFGNGDQQSGKQGQGNPHAGKAKNQSLTLVSDDDEPNIADDGKKKIMSPWQRMKWTENMVRLLILVVFYIGDEAASGASSAEAAGGGNDKKKKGKWKSVSRAMMERGFYVSPQQCEDKFNDLNKRYKRVNDILGKGTACKVVENQSLLDSIDHLSMKTKEEVKKLLNSKQLFFKEMCAYHNSCGHATHDHAGGGGSGGSFEPPLQSRHPRCLHLGENEEGSVDEEEEDDDYDNNNDDDCSDDHHHENDEDEFGDDEENDANEERISSKRQKKDMFDHSPRIEEFRTELTKLLQDGTKSWGDKRQWMGTRMMQLEEERLVFKCKAFEIEKRRLNWLKFCAKKERLMEKEKLTTDRLKLENERMVLLIRRKELELLELQPQQQQSSTTPSRLQDE